jgi:hypothetical protein
MNPSFQVDSTTYNALLQLQVYFGVKGNSAVIKRSLALAQICAESANDTGEVVFVDRVRRREIAVQCR